MSDDKPTRERIRALVRDVLANAVTIDEPVTDDAQTPPLAKIHSLTANAENTTSDERLVRDESAKTIITESDVRDLPEGARLRVAENVRLTPLASDIVRERKIELIKRESRQPTLKAKVIAIGADHGGFEMKEELKTFLEELGCRVRDFGTNSTDAVDYPDFAHAVARAVAEGETEVGIMIDGAGVGSAMTANKVTGVRAAAVYSTEVARNSREHNGANVLTLGSKTITSAQMRDIVRAFLTTEMSEDRHRKRVAKIDAVERQYRA